MDQIICQGCNSNGEVFVTRYNLITGDIMTVKTPLSMSALQSPLSRAVSIVASQEVSSPLSAKVLYFSLKEFLAIRIQETLDGLLGEKKLHKLTGLRDILENHISKDLLYPCNFRMDPIVEIEKLGLSLAVALCIFLRNHVYGSGNIKGRFQG